MNSGSEDFQKKNSPFPYAFILFEGLLKLLD